MMRIFQLAVISFLLPIVAGPPIWADGTHEAPAAHQSGQRCPYCHSGFETEEFQKEEGKCTSCGTETHQGCFAENGGCSIFGCNGKTIQLLSGEQCTVMQSDLKQLQNSAKDLSWQTDATAFGHHVASLLTQIHDAEKEYNRSDIPEDKKEDLRSHLRKLGSELWYATNYMSEYNTNVGNGNKCVFLGRRIPHKYLTLAWGVGWTALTGLALHHWGNDFLAEGFGPAATLALGWAPAILEKVGRVRSRYHKEWHLRETAFPIIARVLKEKGISTKFLQTGDLGVTIENLRFVANQTRVFPRKTRAECIQARTRSFADPSSLGYPWR